jgi:hypothetical protein
LSSISTWPKPCAMPPMIWPLTSIGCPVPTSSTTQADHLRAAGLGIDLDLADVATIREIAAAGAIGGGLIEAGFHAASRLEAANKIYGSRALISEATKAAADATIEVREIDRVMVLGQSRPQVVFEIMGRRCELKPDQDLLRTRYSEGLTAYRARQWSDAQTALKAALETAPGDGPSQTLLDRIATMESDPPGADWDGSWRLDQK